MSTKPLSPRGELVSELPVKLFPIPHWMKCHYTKWETYTVETSSRYHTSEIEHFGVEIRQRRSCNECNKMQDRLVR